MFKRFAWMLLGIAAAAPSAHAQPFGPVYGPGYRPAPQRIVTPRPVNPPHARPVRRCVLERTPFGLQEVCWRGDRW